MDSKPASVDFVRADYVYSVIWGGERFEVRRTRGAGDGVYTFRVTCHRGDASIDVGTFRVSGGAVIATEAEIDGVADDFRTFVDAVLCDPRLAPRIAKPAGPDARQLAMFDEPTHAED